MRRLTRLLLMSMPALLALGLSVHFAMTLAYLTPTNPLKIRFVRLIEAYMSPFFEQNWHLFAPDPLNDTRVVMVACRLRQPDGGTVESGWTDITTPYWEAHLENRLGPATRVARAVTGAARLTYSGDPTSLQMAKKMEERQARPSAGGDGSEAADERLAQVIQDEVKKEQDKSFRLGEEVLNRVGSAHCESLYGPGRTEAVRMRMAVLKFPRFSRRDLPDSEGEMKYYDFPWAPYRPVAPLPMAAGGGGQPSAVSRATDQERR